MSMNKTRREVPRTKDGKAGHRMLLNCPRPLRSNGCMRNDPVRPVRFVLRWLVLIALFAGISGGLAGESTRGSNPLWRKVVMIGASASAGFTISEPLGGTNTIQIRLSRHV